MCLLKVPLLSMLQECLGGVENENPPLHTSFYKVGVNYTSLYQRLPAPPSIGTGAGRGDREGFSK